MSIEITRKQIFDVWVSKIKFKRFDAALAFVLSFFNQIVFSKEATDSLKASLRVFCCKLSDKWAKSGRHLERFQSANSSWLNETFDLPLTFLDEIPSSSSMSFGLSPLHSWIRFMECVLHIGYRLDVKVWQVKDKEAKEIVKARKKHIQDRFRNETGLLVDMPTQQSGNTNDGKTVF